MYKKFISYFSCKPIDNKDIMKNAPILLPIPANLKIRNSFITNETLNSTPEVSFDSTLKEQGYKLSISDKGIQIIAADKAGAFYAEQTLKQLRKQYTNNDCPALDIDDYPDVRIRGISLDYSRDKNMPFEKLLDFVDMIASWKMNMFTLYMEHTFAYKGHEKVWEDAAPLNAEQIRQLDAYCRERFIDLVPQQNTLGHMERWLMHEPYRQMAECPEGVYSSWQLEPDGPFSFCPTDPKAVAFIKSLVDELLPNFSSKYFLGCGDETFDLGKGRSREACEKYGKEKVYGDFFKELIKMVEPHKRILILCGDMVKQNPKAISAMPEDAVLQEWGYGRAYPFEENVKEYIKLNRKFMITCSNSNYSCICGRTYRWRGNIANAARTAAKMGAEMFDCHEFGDFGYWTQFSFSMPGFAYAAANFWNVECNADIDLGAALDMFVYKADGVGDFIMDMGKLYIHTTSEDDDDALFLMLYKRYSRKGESPTQNITLDNLAKTMEDVISLRYRLKRIKNFPSDVKEEVEAALKYQEFAIHVAQEYFMDERAQYLFEMLPSTQHKLAVEFEDVIRTLLKVRDARYPQGGRKIALHWIKRFWMTVCPVVPFPEFPYPQK